MHTGARMQARQSKVEEGDRVMDRPYNVVFLCTENSACPIMAFHERFGAIADPFVRAAACQRPSIRYGVAAPGIDAGDFERSVWLSDRAVDRESIGKLPKRSEAGGSAQRTILNIGP